MQGDNFEALETIIEGGSLPAEVSRTPIELAVEAIVKKITSSLEEIANTFTHYLLQHRGVFVPADLITQNMSEIKFIVAKNNKAYNFDRQARAIAICGKVINVYKRSKASKQQTSQQKEYFNEFVSLIQHGIARLFYDDKYPLNKHEKNYTLDDILLQHQMPDGNYEEVFLCNAVFSPFVPVQKSIVMVIPGKSMKYECSSFLKGSVLHLYVDQAALMSKIVTKETFYKNSILKGIYFIEEGQVEVKSGRIIARGWTTNGKCKTSGIGWKFKPVPFIRFSGKFKVWKQFFNDLKSNEEYPFNIIHILGLNDEDDFTQSVEWKSLGKKKIGGKPAKLPRLMNKSIDQRKYLEIEKMRHYDQRMNGMYSYKKDLLTRKLKGKQHSAFDPIFKPDISNEKTDRKLLKKYSSKKADYLSSEMQKMQATENILILSVLKKLESITDFDEGKQNKGKKKSQQNKKSNIKITPLQLYQKQKKKVRKSNRYLF